MTYHDINRIENALFILLQYQHDDNFKQIISEVLQHDEMTKGEFFDRLEEIKMYF